jgi:hypothetical protein
VQPSLIVFLINVYIHHIRISVTLGIQWVDVRKMEFSYLIFGKKNEKVTRKIISHVIFVCPRHKIWTCALTELENYTTIFSSFEVSTTLHTTIVFF